MDMPEGIAATTVDEIVAEIEMSRMNWNGPFLVLEGEFDSKFWRPRKRDSCEIVIAWGRAKVLGALAALGARGFTGAVGIVDDDFDTLLGTDLNAPNIISTDPRDIEGILLRSGAIDKLLAEYGDAMRIRAFLEKEPGSVRDSLLRRASIFGRIHWLNHIAPVPVSLDDLKPQRFCDLRTWTYDEAAVIAEAVRLGVSPTNEELVARLYALPEAQAWHICRGHDLVDILTGGLLRVLGRGKARHPVVESTLRVALEQHELRATNVYRRLRNWQVNQPQYAVLRAEDESGAPPMERPS